MVQDNWQRIFEYKSWDEIDTDGDGVLTTGTPRLQIHTYVRMDE
jgi:hypothetical protein